MAQRLAKEEGYDFHICYPKSKVHGWPSSAFKRNTRIVERADLVLAFYSKDRYQIGGTADTAEKARQMNVPLIEFREE